METNIGKFKEYLNSIEKTLSTRPSDFSDECWFMIKKDLKIIETQIKTIQTKINSGITDTKNSSKPLF